MKARREKCSKFVVVALPLLCWAKLASAEPQVPASSTPPSAAAAPAKPDEAAARAASPDVPANEAVSAPAKREPEVVPAKSPERQHSLEPKPAEPKTPGRATFHIDPIADGAIVGVSLGFATVLDLINSTGEIRPQQIEPGFDRSKLLGIDEAAINQTPSSGAGARSNLGFLGALAFAAIDPVLSGVRERSVQTGLVDFVLYAESVSLALAMTNMVKMAVRRPRPLAYIEADEHKDDPNYSNASTDSSLSFFSGHSAMTAAVGATATYLAFTRAPHTARPWLTLTLATGLAAFVSVERVRSAKHFPTDVIAASIAGAGIGVAVPHLHRSEDVTQRRVWVGFAPEGAGGRGGLLNVQGVF